VAAVNPLVTAAGVAAARELAYGSGIELGAGRAETTGA